MNYTPHQVLIMEIGLDLERLAKTDYIAEVGFENGLREARWGEQVRAAQEGRLTGPEARAAILNYMGPQ